MNGSGHQRRVSYRLLITVLWATLLAFAIELSAGWISHSLCLLAESLHTLIDVFSALLGLVAVASPQRTLGKEIWGYGRGEAAGALMLSAALGFAGISIVIIAFSQLDEAFFETTRGAFQVAVTGPLLVLVGVMVSLVMAATGTALYQSKHINSLALRLTAQHIVKDVWLTGLTLVG
ncbi:MAG: cation transporter, partial [Phormidesmis sp.]